MRTTVRVLRTIFVVSCVLASSLAAAQNGYSTKQGKAEAKQEESLLTREIRHQIAVLPYYSVFDYVTFTLNGNMVILEGYAIRPTLRESAEAVVRSIEGVSSVTNKIEVLPKSASDDELRREVYRAVFEDVTLQRYAAREVPPLHIIVKNGAVILAGAVVSEGDKSLAAARAKSVSGVGSFESRLQVRNVDPSKATRE